MNVPKVFRPRRGLYFSDDLTSRPNAYFIGGPSSDRTRQTQPVKANSLVQTYPSVVPTGSVQTSVISAPDPIHLKMNPGNAIPVIVTSSLSVGGSTSYGRLYTRGKLNATLLGESEATSLGYHPYSNVVIDAAGNPTGTFTSPSWTHKSKGFNQAFVGVSLSSSYEETHTLNYYRSGSAPLEQSPVPASASIFYSKQSRFNRIIVKLTSSNPQGLVDDANFGTLVSPTSSVGQPAKWYFSVPVEGKLTDIRVWVEMVTLSGTNSCGSTGSAGHLVWAGVASPTIFPLESFGISLRSPNVSWPGHHAHPIMNDPQYLRHLTVTASQDAVDQGPNYYNPPEFYRDAYLLWEPWPLYNYSGGSPTLIRPFQPVWGHDLGMRTIFCDGSPIRNPRALLPNYPPDLQVNGAPNVTGSWPNLVPGTYQLGNNTPWTTDSGTWGTHSTALAAYGSTPGSPPAGWLTGPSSTTGSNEWPTTGSTLGATTLQPIYPFLDTVYQNLYGLAPAGTSGAPSGWQTPGQSGLPIDVLYPDYPLWKGSRPGLRGTEISGTWTMMFATPAVVWFSGSASWTFVRQARIEITYSQNRSGGLLRDAGRGLRPWSGGPRFCSLLSGSDNYQFFVDVGVANQGCFVHATYAATQPSNPGMNFGLFVGTGSIPASKALQWWLTGTIADCSGTGPAWLTNNRWNMPVIPISSASLVQVTASIPATASPVPFIVQSTLIPPPNRLVQSSEDANPRLSLVDLASKFVSGTLTETDT